MKKFLTLFLSLIVCILVIGGTACYEPQKDAVNVKYYATPADISPLILAGNETIGLIPEPAATALQNEALKQGKTLYRMDLQEHYDSQEKAYPQAVLMVKKSVINAHEGLAQNLEQKIAQSVDWAKENPASAVTAIGNNGATTLKAPALTNDVIDACKIYWQSADNAKQSVKAYINNIIEIDSTKANQVNDDFFYTPSASTNQKQQYTFIAPDGAPAIAISKLMNDSDNLNTGKPISYSIVVADTIQSEVASGQADFVLAPVNLASKLYKAHDSVDHYVMVAVITHGNFYIISDSPLTIDDLQGKQVAVPMKGAVPDWTFQMVLKKNNIPFVVVK